MGIFLYYRLCGRFDGYDKVIFRNCMYNLRGWGMEIMLDILIWCGKLV